MEAQLETDFWKRSAFPFINSRNLLEQLAEQASLTEQKHTLVLAGPKDCGKSRAIQHILPAWKKLGHTVIDINLKGKAATVTVREILTNEAKELYTNFLDGLTPDRFSCVYTTFYQQCSRSKQSSFVWDIASYSNYVEVVVQDVWPVVCSTVFAIYVCLEKKWYSVVVIPVLVVCLGISSLRILNNVKEFLRLLNDTISFGDWQTLACFCTVMCTCVPQQRPILIVREFSNLDDGDVEGLFKSLETMKEGKLPFPVILETSDFLWFNHSAVRKSSSSFQTYYVDEMSFVEGRAELVDKLKMWDVHNFTKVYKTVGGHMGSLYRLWHYIRYDRHKLSLEDHLQQLKEKRYVHLMQCMSELSEKFTLDEVQSLNSFLSELKAKNFSLRATPALLGSVKYLLKCNVLFLRSDVGYTIFPQNPLFRYAINTYLLDVFPESNATHLQD